MVLGWLLACAYLAMPAVAFPVLTLHFTPLEM